jgi:hypothetical protein
MKRIVEMDLTLDKKDIMLRMMEDFKIEFIENSNRSIVGKTCSYMPIDEKSAGCAIGLYLTEEQCKCGDNVGSICRATQWELPNFLPTWMLNLDINFLEDLQKLHDEYDFWYNGKFIAVNRYEQIIENINSNCYL